MKDKRGSYVSTSDASLLPDEAFWGAGSWMASSLPAVRSWRRRAERGEDGGTGADAEPVPAVRRGRRVASGIRWARRRRRRKQRRRLTTTADGEEPFGQPAAGADVASPTGPYVEGTGKSEREHARPSGFMRTRERAGPFASERAATGHGAGASRGLYRRAPETDVPNAERPAE